MLSDHDHQVARRYRSWEPGSPYNRRTVFVIDGKGILRYIDLNYSVRGKADYERLKEALERVGQAKEEGSGP